jgi:lipid-A-disaccharide synthase
VVAYKANPISAYIIRRIIKIPYACLVNIIFGRMLVPELIQENCTAQNIADALQKFEGVNVAELTNILSNDQQITASQRAAQSVLEVLS